MIQNMFCRSAMVAVLAMVLTVISTGLAQAQFDLPPEEGAADRERIEGLIETLEDEGARQDLIEHLRTLLEVTEPDDPPPLFLPQPQTIGAQGLSYISNQLSALGTYASAVGDALVALPEVADWFISQMEEPEHRAAWIDVLISLVIILGAAIAARFGTAYLIRKPAAVADARQGKTFMTRFIVLAVSSLLDLIPLAAFLLAAYAALSIINPIEQIRLVILAVINASALTGLVAVVARFILTPRVPHLRLYPLSNETAVYLYIWIRRIAFTAVYSYFITEAAQALGMPLGARNALLVAVGVLIALMLIMIILQNRHPVAAGLRGTRPEPGERRSTVDTLRRRFADVWHVLAIIYVLSTFTVIALDIEGGLTFLLRGTLMTVIAVIVARLVLMAIDMGTVRLFRIKPDLLAHYPNLEKRANLYLPLVTRIAKGLVLLVTAFTILEAWSLGGLAWIRTDFGSAALSSAISVTVILTIAIVAWEMVSSAVERRLNVTDAAGLPVEQNARVRTLLPLLRNAFLVVLIAIVGLIVLSEIGVNIAPLLAGAGVIGLAIGFGAQTLVRDVITGLFILFEDWFNVGDVVDIGGRSGVVEGLTIRTVRLRDLSGSVHTIQFGDVTSATNMTKDFSYALLDIEVAYREDTDQVATIMQEVAADLQADPEYGKVILEPIEILGVDSFQASGVVVRGRIKTKPIFQWWTAREYRRRIKKRFDAEGIEIPFPHTTMYFGRDKDGSAPAANVALNASSIREMLEPSEGQSTATPEATAAAATPRTGYAVRPEPSAGETEEDDGTERGSSSAGGAQVPPEGSETGRS